MRMNHVDPSYGPYQIFELNNFSDHSTISSDSDDYDDDSDQSFGIDDIFNLYHHDSNSPEILEDMKSQFHVVNHVMNQLIGISRTIKTYSLSNNEETKIISEISSFGNRSKVCYFLHLRIRYWIEKYCSSSIHSGIIMLKQLA